MNQGTSEFDRVLSTFHTSWPIDRIETMTIEEYANLSDHDSFCYWLEYGSKNIGAIGAIPLNKFEFWKSKDRKDLKDQRFTTDGTFIWNTKKGTTKENAFNKIKLLILEIIHQAQKENWRAIEQIEFHAIGKWKIAFLYSNKKLLPIYSKRALLAITKGLGREFSYYTPIYQLQQYILSFRDDTETVEELAFRLYAKFAEKKNKRNFYIIGSKYADRNGNDVIPKIDDFIRNRCVAFDFLDSMDFTLYMGADKNTVNEFVKNNWKENKPSLSKIQSYFYLLSQIKEGDIIAVKSHGSHNTLTIIAYAEVVKRNGTVYEYQKKNLGHHIHVEYLDAGFHKKLELTYAAAIHHLTIKKDKEKFYKIFGWYGDYFETDNKVDSFEDDYEYQTNKGKDDCYNEKAELSFERSASVSVTVKRIHNRIQNRFVKYLKATYPEDLCGGEIQYIDAKRESQNEIFIYEIKPYESVYACIRSGIGQLLDYSHKLKSKKTKRIFIVGPNKPEPYDSDFIIELKRILMIPFGYIAFDEITSTVVEF